jgi:1,4-dihydroxy-2-naphthoate octaprenyltransferase
MSGPNGIKVWLAQSRANFLILAVLLVAIGLVYAAKYNPGGGFDPFHAVLLVLGVVAAHMSVNLFNEYSDYNTRIDFNTIQTPFSGGSKMLIEGHTKPRSVLAAGITTLFIALGIGLYFTVVSHWSIILFIIIGGLTIMFYTNFLAKIAMGEIFAGLTLGTMVVLGTYIAMVASPSMSFGAIIPQEVWLISIPPGILTSLLLLLNEFPDAEMDKEGGRNHLVIKFGKKVAAYIYAFGLLITFGTIVILPLAGISSYWLYLALLPLPIAFKAGMTAIKHGDDMQKLVPSMGMNVMVVLGTDLLVAVSVLMGMI